MNTQTDGITLLIALGSGVFCLIRGLKGKRCQGKEQVSKLYMIMAACAIVFVVLALLVHVFNPTRSVARLVLVLQGFDIGTWFGIFIAMRILKLLKPISNEAGT